MIENITNIANELMQSARFPLLAALLLGLLVAFNPCQLAINISALTYMHKNGRGRKANTLMGIAYVLGRMTTYTVMGWILIFVIRQSNSIDAFKNLLSKAEDFLPYVLGGIGVFLIIKAFMTHHHHGDNCHNSGRLIKTNGSAGPFILGMALALAFCPESAIFYFGMLIPLSASQPAGWLMPVLFALAASLPVIILSMLISTAMQTVRRFEHMSAHFQRWLNIITGVIFLVIALSL